MDLAKQAAIADILEGALMARAPAQSERALARDVARLEYLMIGCLFHALEHGSAAYVSGDPAWGWPAVPRRLL